MATPLPADRVPAVLAVLSERAYGDDDGASDNASRNPSPYWDVKIEEHSFWVAATAKSTRDTAAEAYADAEQLRDALLEAVGEDSLRVSPNHVGTGIADRSGGSDAREFAGWYGTVDLRLWAAPR